MKKNQQSLKAARRAKTRKEWEARQAAARAAAKAQAFNPVLYPGSTVVEKRVAVTPANLARMKP